VLGIALALSSVALPSPVGAQSWVKTAAQHTNWISIGCSADGSNLVAAASGYLAGGDPVPGPIFISKDSGITWIQTQAPILDWIRVVSSVDGEKIFATYWSNDRSRLWSSTNGGSTWSAQGYLTNAFLLASSSNGTTIVAGGGGSPYLAASIDGGVSWTYTSLPGGAIPEGGFVVSADGTRLMASVLDPSITFLWMYASTDSGRTWTANVGPDNSSNFWVAFAGAADATRLVLAVNQLGLFTSPDWGQTWQVRVEPWQGWPTGIPPSEVGQSIASSADASKLMLSANGSIYESTNSGVSWFKTDAPSEGSLAGSADGSKFFVLAGGDIYRFDSTPSLPTAVKLRITQVQNTLVLSWDGPTGILQQTDYLGTTNWVRVPTQPVLTNGQLQVTVEPSALGMSFYRLSQP